jgi:hypothetical protein
MQSNLKENKKEEVKNHIQTVSLKRNPITISHQRNLIVNLSMNHLNVCMNHLNVSMSHLNVNMNHHLTTAPMTVKISPITLENPIEQRNAMTPITVNQNAMLYVSQ